MRGIYKVLGGLCALLLMAGALLALTGWFMGARNAPAVRPWMFGSASFHSGWEDTPDRDGWTYESGERLDPFDDVKIDIDLGSVTFERAEDFGVSLSWTEGGADYRLHYAVENRALRIWSTSRRGVNLDALNPGGSVTVYLPNGADLDEVELDLDLGDAYLSDFRAKSLKVDADLGEASIERVTAGKADITLDLGNLTLTECRFDSADLDLSMGDLDAYDLTVTGTLVVDADAGAVDLDGTLGTETEITADLGSVTLYTRLPLRECGYDLEVDLGSITVDGEDYHGKAVRSGGTHHIQVEASMGNIELSFAP